MLNLVRQQEQLGEELQQAVLGVVADALYASTDGVTPFEAKLARYCGRPHAVGVGSGTAALHLALVAAGVGPGDEVVTVPNSFVATAEAIVHAGARPRFVDVDPRTHLIDLGAVQGALTDATRAIVPVHLYGNVVDVEALERMLEHVGRPDIAIVEDCAHAIGARRAGRPVPLGPIGAFSFNPGKNLGALGDAGAVVTSNADVAERVRLLRDHGRATKNDHVVIGFNSRLGRIDDAVLALKLDHLDRWTDRRRAIARRYATASGNHRVPPAVEPAYHQYVVVTRDRDRFRRHLARAGITTAVHYPRLIPEQDAFRRLGYTLAGLENASELNRLIVSIPCYSELTDAEVDRIVAAVTSFESDSPAKQLAQTG